MHTPLIAAAMGLPQVSSRLRMSGYCRTPSTKARIAASLPSALARRAYSWPAVSSIVRSAPAAKPSLPDVNTAPLIASSVAILSTIRPSSPTTSLLITFIERPGMSQVTRATPSASVSKRKLVRFMVAGLRSRSDAFDDRGGAHAAADAKRDERSALAGALEFVERGAKDHRSRGAERMAHGDRAAVDVDLARVDVERLKEAQNDRGEGLVDFEEVDVAHFHPGAGQHLLRHVDRAGQHDRRLRTDIGERPHPRPGLEASLRPGLARTQKHRRGAVDDARRIAGVMDMDDAFDFRMGLNGHRVEAALLAGNDERGLERGQRLHVRVRPHVLVVVEQRQAVGVEDRRDRAPEPALLPRRRGTLLRLDRVSVDVVAREAIFGRNQVRRYALRHEIGRNRERRIDRPRAAGRADADAAHRLDAAPDRHVVLAAHHLRGGEIDRVEA